MREAPSKVREKRMVGGKEAGQSREGKGQVKDHAARQGEAGRDRPMRESEGASMCRVREGGRESGGGKPEVEAASYFLKEPKQNETTPWMHYSATSYVL